ncbi:MAG: methyltransferase domain-containing protein [Gammaproteobacteria bacterium]|nr:methyltransferase domain-containing protein [Gammaproteobacteria bacterium]
MHSLGNSIRKRWHSLTVSPGRMQKLWGDSYWKQDGAGDRSVSCNHCPRLDADSQQCTVNFGTPLRKCVVASVEAHLQNCKDKKVLEVGYGRFSLGKNLVNRSGGIWSGIEPQQPRDKVPSLGKGGYGHATEILFPDNTFDLIYGIQTMEHWGQQCTGGTREPSCYIECMAEIYRVLKPGGSIYFDVPIHFHGHEMFIMADFDKIKSLFHESRWQNVVLEKWRYDSEPLERYAPYEKLFPEWDMEISSYSREAIEKAKGEPIYLLAITANKVA